MEDLSQFELLNPATTAKSLLQVPVYRTPDGGYVVQHSNRQEWYNQLGKRHRKNGPAIEASNGYKAWWISDKLHRENGPAVVHADGGEEWLLHGERHRIDGPAIIKPDGSEQWWLNGKLHRMDGPAVISCSPGKEGVQWWENGKKISEMEVEVLSVEKLKGYHQQKSNEEESELDFNSLAKANVISGPK